MSLNSREMDDKVSKIMGSYLLKGYTLLDSYCQTCQTPLMRSRNGEIYCIYCNEINEISTQKSINSSNDCSDVCEMIDDKENETQVMVNNERIVLIKSFNSDIETTIAIVHKKLKWATNRLDNCEPVYECIQLTNLIKSCADSLESLKRLVDTQKREPMVL